MDFLSTPIKSFFETDYWYKIFNSTFLNLSFFAKTKEKLSNSIATLYSLYCSLKEIKSMNKEF